MFLFFYRWLAFALLSSLCWPVLSAARFEDTMAQRTLACTACHGQEGRAGPDGYYPRLAGKPVGYLYSQLLNFRDGRRHYSLMEGLLAPLTDDYLLEIARYFSGLALPYPPPRANLAPQQVLARGRQLATQGDLSQKIPACTQCHGLALTGVAPHIPGLLGLPRDYINAQLGAWQTQQRRAQAPDCMAHIAGKLVGSDVAAVSFWLSSQVLPADTRPVSALPVLAKGEQRLDCGRAPSHLAPTQAALSASSAATSAAAQGAYLARAGNCMACHTARGGVPFAGGRPIETPFGTVYSSNLTSHPQAGLGSWSAADFWQAMHQGRSKDGHLLNPAFPYTSFTQITRADSDALFTFFQTVAPSAQANRPDALRWPFGTAAALTVWRALYFTPATFQTQPAQTDEWNRGAYLVRGLGHCGACHTPRNALGGSDVKQELAGALLPMQNGYAPSLRPAREAADSNENTARTLELLKTGVSSHQAVSGSMAEVVLGSTQHLTASDLRAMAMFLRSLPPAPTQDTAPPRGEATTAARLTSGAKLYDKHCAACHGEQGEGVKGAYPSLAHNPAVTRPDPTNLVQMVLRGGYAPATVGNPRPFGMPPFVLKLNDRETAEVLSYIRTSWGNPAAQVTELNVTLLRQRQ